ncbi:MAG TPA: hypothetical protein VK705_01540 [Ferruginibacter sp.]|jgi:hypothetical protein|nr:hypothetical protein [Ferruginibacter sp.]
MRYTILIVAISLIFLGCKKNKTSKPSLTFKSVNSTVIQEGELLVFTLSFKNIQSSPSDTLVVQEIVPCPLSQFSQNFGLPVFSAASNQGGDITISFVNHNIVPPYQTISAQCDSDDIAHFQFTLINANNIKSDSILSPQIIIKQ